jgi:hypothetical protein
MLFSLGVPFDLAHRFSFFIIASLNCASFIDSIINAIKRDNAEKAFAEKS